MGLANTGLILWEIKSRSAIFVYHLRDVCLRIVVSNIYRVVFLFCLSSSCLLYLIAPLVFSNVYL